MDGINAAVVFGKKEKGFIKNVPEAAQEKSKATGSNVTKAADEVSYFSFCVKAIERVIAKSQNLYAKEKRRLHAFILL